MFSIGQPKPNSKKHIYQLHYSPKLHQKLLQQSDISISQTSSQVSNKIPNNLQINGKISAAQKYQQKRQQKSINQLRKVCQSDQSQNRKETVVSRDLDKNRKWWGKIQIGLAVVAAEIRANVENFILQADSQCMSKKLQANIQAMLLNMLQSATRISTLCNTISKQAPHTFPQPMKIPINSQRISDKNSQTSNISRNNVINSKNSIKKSLIKIEDSYDRDEGQDESSMRQNDECECGQECVCKEEQDGHIGQNIGRWVDGRLSVLKQASYEVSSSQNSMYREQQSNIFNPQYPPPSPNNLLQQLLKLPTQIPKIPPLIPNNQKQKKSLKIQQPHHKISDKIPYRKDNNYLYQYVNKCQQITDNYCLDSQRQRYQSQQDMQSDIGSQLAIQEPSWFGVRGGLGEEAVEEAVEECSISQYYIEDSPTPHKQTQQKQNILPKNSIFSHHHPSTSNCHPFPRHHPFQNNQQIQHPVQSKKDIDNANTNTYTNQHSNQHSNINQHSNTNTNTNTNMHDSTGIGYVYSQVLSRRKIF